MASKYNKKAISPLIATVVIIGFTIIVGVLVIAWLSGVFQTQFGSEECTIKAQEYCSKLNSVISLSAATNNEETQTLARIVWFGEQESRPELIKVAFLDENGDTLQIEDASWSNGIAEAFDGVAKTVEATVLYTPTIPKASCQQIVCPPIREEVVPSSGTFGMGGEIPIGEIIGRVTDNSATINLINRYNESVDLKIEYYTNPGSPFETSNITGISSNDTAEFQLTNLNSAEQWKYRVMYKIVTDTDYIYGPERTFHTQRPAGEEFNFTLFSDSHLVPDEGNPYFQRCTSILTDELGKKSTDFSIAIGDNIFYQGQDLEDLYKISRKCYDMVHHSIPLYVVIGNWEGENGWDFHQEALGNRSKYIPNPNSTTYQEGGSDNEDYYAFTWGDALFIILNVQSYTMTNHELNNETGTVYDWTLGETQFQWFNNTLQNSNKKWKFVFIHHTVGGNGLDEANSRYGRGGGRAAYVGNQSIIHNIMKENNVSVFFYGHDHSFFDMVVDGIHYTQIANIGTYFHFAKMAGYDSMGLPYWNLYGYAFVQVKSDRVIVDFINETGELLNTFAVYQPDPTDNERPQLNNYAPVTQADANQNITIRVNVTDNKGVSHVFLYYRHTNQTLYSNIFSMTPIGNDEYETDINSSLSTRNIEYFIHAEDINGNSNNTDPTNITVLYEARLTNDDVVDWIIYDGHTDGTDIDSTSTAIRIGTTAVLRGFIDFNTSLIPDISVIDKVYLNFTTGTSSNPNVSIKNLTQKAIDYPDANSLWNAIGNGEEYANQTLTPQSNYLVDLGQSAASDLQDRLPEDWFSVGLQSAESGSEVSRIFSEEYTGDISSRPALVVTYHIE